MTPKLELCFVNVLNFLLWHTAPRTPHIISFILLIFLIIPSWSFAQQGKEFFLEAYNKTDLTPISQTQNGKYIELQFSDPQLTSIFVNLKILAYKDYAEVELTYKPNRITSLSPNPTTGQVEVEYKSIQAKVLIWQLLLLKTPIFPTIIYWIQKILHLI